MKNIEKIDAKEITKIANDILTAPFAQLGNHNEYEWVKLPWEGIWNKVLFFDRTTGATIELAKTQKGATFPEHYHPSVQTLFLVQGRIINNDSILTPGTFNVIPAGQVHGPFFAEEESIQFKYFSAAPVYILKNGDVFIYREDGTTIAGGKLSIPEELEKKNFIRKA